MPIARVAGASTPAGRLIIGPAGCPLINPSAITDAITAPLCEKTSIRPANIMQPTTRTVCGRFIRSATNPPKGTLNRETHSTMLITDPAGAIDQPRSTSIVGPKLKIVAKPTLNKPQIRPATVTAIAAWKSNRTDDVAAVAALDGGRYPAARTIPNAISAATAR